MASNGQNDPRDDAAAPNRVPGDDSTTQSAARRSAHGELTAGSSRLAAEEFSVDDPTTGPALPVIQESEKTVISSRPPVSDFSDVAATPGEMGETLEGRRLGHFRLEKFVGGGGMGAVFKAFDTMLGRTVAVKVLSRRQADDDETVRRFKNEAQSAARLDHENIARVYFVGEDDGWNFIVFEFIEGINIRDLVARRGPLPLEETIGYLLQIGEALAHASRRDVVHRDIKPSNILITPEGRAKLVDMGLARLHQVETGQDDLTASGVTLGTFDYISPEQARDPRASDVRSDLYSLGCTFYFMLTGRPPFPTGTVLQKLLSHSSDPPPDPRQLRPDLPDEVTTIVHRMLAKRPLDRYQEPGEMIGQLLLLAERCGLSNVGRDRAIWLAPGDHLRGWGRHLPWLVPVLVLAFVVVGVDLFGRFVSGGSEQLPAFVMPDETSDPEHRGSPRTPDDGAEPSKAKDARSTTKDSNGGGSSPEASGASFDALDSGKNADPSDGDATEPSSPGVAPDGRSPVPRDDDRGPDDASASDNGGAATPDVENGNGREGDNGDQPEAAPSTITTLIVGGSTSEASPPAGAWVVDSLAAAAAKTRELSPPPAVIELHYNGVRRERPLRLALGDEKLTIRAGEGFAPVVRFLPTGEDVSRGRLSMISVGGGDLSLAGVHLELDIPRSPPVDRWALFELTATRHLELAGCTMTVRNAGPGRTAYHQGVAALIDVASVSGGAGRLGDDDDATQLVVPISMENCVVRGEATLVRAAEVVPLRLRWKGGLLITTERLLATSGTTREFVNGDHVTLDLDHVTIVADLGVSRMTNGEEAPYQIPLDVHARYCVFVSEPGAALFEQQGLSTVRRYRDQMHFSGEHNFYYDTRLFWRIDADRSDDRIEEFDWHAWREEWADQERLSQLGGVKWRRPAPADAPVSSLTPADYRLFPEPSNPSFDAGAGFDPKTLPSLPNVSPAPATETSRVSREAAAPRVH